MVNDEYVTVATARERFKVTKYRMTKLIQNGVIPTYENVYDGRSRLMKIADVAKATQRDTPQPQAPIRHKGRKSQG